MRYCRISPGSTAYCVEKGIVRQFVAMPLGAGYTVEEQLTGAAEHGGMQFVAYPMKAERYEALLREQTGCPWRRPLFLRPA